ncbi:hypothetical protein D3C78_738880 [compost metagenome]
MCLDNIVVTGAAGFAIVGLDQHPLLFFAIQVGAKQVPHPGQLLALQTKAQLALGVSLTGISFRLPDATVPDDDITGAVMPFGYAALEVGVVERVVLDMHRQAADLRVKRWSFGDCPAFQGAIEFQAKVIVQVAGVVFLDAVLQGVRVFAAGRFAQGFGCGVEVTFALVFLQELGHGDSRTIGESLELGGRCEWESSI